MDTKFVMYDGTSEKKRLMYQDLIAKGLIIIHEGQSPEVGKGKRFLCRVHNSDKLNSLIELPFRAVWYHYYCRKNDLENFERKIIVFCDVCKLARDTSFIQYLRKRYKGCKIVYMFSAVYNVSHAKKYGYYDNLKDIYDFVVTFEKNDAINLGWQYLVYPYEKIKVGKSSFDNSDVYYVGDAKIKQYPERYNTIIQVYKRCTEIGLKCDFHINNVGEREQYKADGIVYNQPISYIENIQRLMKTKAILEVTQFDQTGTTLRVQEAYTYHKKLITNNVAIKNESWYYADTVCAFVDVCEIETSFFNNEALMHDLSNLFSPKRFLDSIENLCYGGKNEK